MTEWEKYGYMDGPETIESLRAQRDDARRRVADLLAMVDEIRGIVGASPGGLTIQAVKGSLADTRNATVMQEPDFDATTRKMWVEFNAHTSGPSRCATGVPSSGKDGA